MKKDKIFFLPIILGLIFIMHACVDVPSDIQPPRFDVVLNFPITDTSYTLDEALGDDSTLVASDDPASLGLLVYSQTNDISTFYIEDNLSLDGFSTRSSQVIGSVKINDVTPINTGVLVSDWANVTPGTRSVFPENVGEVNVGFPKIEQFNSVTLDGGSLIITVTNNLPVESELRGLVIKNAVDGSIIAQRTAAEVIDLPVGSDTTITFDLTNKTVKDSLVYSGTIYTPGSNGQEVDIPASSGTDLTVAFDGLSIAAVTAVLPAQDPFSKSSTAVIDDSTFLEKAVFEEGSFEITFDNNIDLDVNLALQIDNLLDPNGNSYSENVTLNALELNKKIGVPDLSGWSIASLTSDPTNELSYSAVITPITSSSPRTITKNDSVGIDIAFGSIVFRSVSGKIKPTTFSISESSFSFDLGDVKNSFNYTDINFNDPAIMLKLKSSAQMEFELNGNLFGTNGITSSNMSLNNVIIASQGSNVIDLRDYGLKNFLNGFDSAIPDSFIFSGNATVNPNFTVGSVERTDSVGGGISIDIPLDIGIAGGTFRDTLEIDSLSISDEDIDAINFAEITIEMENAIPVGLSVSGNVLDANKTPILAFPPSYNASSSIDITAPSVDNNGNVDQPSVTKQVITLKGEDAKIFINNPTLELSVSLETPPAGTANPVKFRNTDYIKVKLYGSVGYRVNN